MGPWFREVVGSRNLWLPFLSITQSPENFAKVMIVHLLFPITVLKFHDGGEGGFSDNRVPDSAAAAAAAAAAGEGSSGYAYTTSCLVKGESASDFHRPISDLIEIPKLANGNVLVFLQLIFSPHRPMNQLNKSPNIL